MLQQQVVKEEYTILVGDLETVKYKHAVGQIRASGLQLQVSSLTEEMIDLIEISTKVKDKETLKEELHGLKRERNSK